MEVSSSIKGEVEFKLAKSTTDYSTIISDFVNFYMCHELFLVKIKKNVKNFIKIYLLFPRNLSVFESPS